MQQDHRQNRKSAQHINTRVSIILLCRSMKYLFKHFSQETQCCELAESCPSAIARLTSSGICPATKKVVWHPRFNALTTGAVTTSVTSCATTPVATLVVARRKNEPTTTAPAPITLPPA